MNRFLVRVNAASEIRRAWEHVAGASSALVVLGDRELASKLDDLVVQLLRLHDKVLDLADQSPGASGEKELPRGHDYGIPF